MTVRNASTDQVLSFGAVVGGEGVYGLGIQQPDILHVILAGWLPGWYWSRGSVSWTGHCAGVTGLCLQQTHHGPSVHSGLLSPREDTETLTVAQPPTGQHPPLGTSVVAGAQGMTRECCCGDGMFQTLLGSGVHSCMHNPRNSRFHAFHGS